MFKELELNEVMNIDGGYLTYAESQGTYTDGSEYSDTTRKVIETVGVVFNNTIAEPIIYPALESAVKFIGEVHEVWK